jgi:Tfp pilus assembly major pilin PilA
MKYWRRCAGEGGFSTAELLIVVSIAGIIAAIAIPIYIDQKNRATVTATMANLEAMRMGLSHYAAGSQSNKFPGGPLDYRTFVSAVPECNMPLLEADAKIATASFAYSSNGLGYTIYATSTDRSETRFVVTPAGILYN